MSYLHLVVRLAAFLTVVVPTLFATRGFWKDATTYGFHDWDVMAAHRLLVKQSILEHGEFPGWNPYLCGGFPAWGYIEGGTTVVSPLLPVYLLVDLPRALRIEVVAMGLLGAVGTYHAAGFFSRAIGPRALAVALFAVNGRFGLQVASGHLWHLAYALLPWCVAFYLAGATADLGRRPRAVVLLGVTLAWMVYAGGIYPLPHAVLALCVLAVVHALQQRSLRPLGVVVGGGAVGIGLSAPKLLPMLATFSVAPRVVASNEVFSLPNLYVALTSRTQGFYDRPAPVKPYGWHEWGIYVGVVGVALLVAALLFAWRRELAAPKLVAVLLLTLGLGAFHPAAPWSLLHAHAPFFGSLHVPSRFLHPAVFFGGLVVAGGVAALLREVRRRRASLAPWMDAACGIAAFVLSLDVASVAKQPLDQTMWMVAPAVVRETDFTTAERSPISYVKRDWADSMLLPTMANTGVLQCYGLPEGGPRGAVARTDDAYRGEAHVEPAGDVSRDASARIVERTNDRIVVELAEVREGDRVMVNVNALQGWRAVSVGPDGFSSALDLVSGDRLGALARDGTSRIVFAYAPPYLGLGVVVAGLTVLASAAALVHAARVRRRVGAIA